MEEEGRFVAVDIGNSGLRIASITLGTTPHVAAIEQVRWGNPEVSASGGSVTRSRQLPGGRQWWATIHEFLERSGLEHVPLRWIVSSVHREASGSLASLVGERSLDSLHFVTRHDLDLQIDVTEPDRVGVDRLLAAYAAANRFSQRPLIVLQAGSALTVDLLVAQRVYSGGAILPGIPMMLRLLGIAADLLPQVDADELTELPELPGRDTVAAMKCGASSALVGGAEHLVRRYREQFSPEALIVLSGGDGFRMAPHLPPPMQVVPQLVLQGLLDLAVRMNHRLDGR